MIERPGEGTLPERWLVVLHALVTACHAERAGCVPTQTVVYHAQLSGPAVLGRLLALRDRGYVRHLPADRHRPSRWAPTDKAHGYLKYPA